MSKMIDTQSRVLAYDAIKTVPDLDSDLIYDFLATVSEKQKPPSYYHQDVPIWCYWLNEDLVEIPKGFSGPKIDIGSGQNHVELVENCFGVYSNVEGRSVLVIVPIEIVCTTMKERAFERPSLAELKLAANLLVGKSIADISANDQVSYETRRNQFKSLSGKMGLSRQQDVVRILMQDLMLAIAPTLSVGDDHALLYEFADKFLPVGVRLSILGQREGAAARVIEYGPLSGRPVIILHPMIFPDITKENVDFALENNLRILFPLRPGLLTARTNIGNQVAYRKEAQLCLNVVWQHYCGQAVPLIAMVSSGAQATEYSLSHPDRVSSITFAATCFSAGHYKSSLIYFGSSVAELALRSEWLLSKTMAVLRK